MKRLITSAMILLVLILATSCVTTCAYYDGGMDKPSTRYERGSLIKLDKNGKVVRRKEPPRNARQRGY